MIVFSYLFGTLLLPTIDNYMQWVSPNNTSDPGTTREGEQYIGRYWAKFQNNPNNAVKEFIKTTSPENYYVFIATDNQDKGLQLSIKENNLTPYIHYESPWFNNPNTAYMRCNLKLYIFNFKDYKHE